MKTNRFFIAIGLLICLLATPATLNAADAKPQADQTLSTNEFVTVKINVIDENGEPVIGASVLIIKYWTTVGGAMTDVDGKALLQVELPAKLRICYLGYQDAIIVVSQNVTELTVQLKPNDELS